MSVMGYLPIRLKALSFMSALRNSENKLRRKEMGHSGVYH